ncbi:MAG: hypothetical protein ABL877_12465, partial [Thiobacillus sp.]
GSGGAESGGVGGGGIGGDWRPFGQMKHFRTHLLPLLFFPWFSTVNAADAKFPSDVEAFIATRENCDHWRGEYPYDKEREADIHWNICQACLGTDVQLADLKIKYTNVVEIISLLNTLELEIEPNPRFGDFCRSLKEPSGI